LSNTATRSSTGTAPDPPSTRGLDEPTCGLPGKAVSPAGKQLGSHLTTPTVVTGGASPVTCPFWDVRDTRGPRFTSRCSGIQAQGRHSAGSYVCGTDRVVVSGQLPGAGAVLRTLVALRPQKSNLTSWGGAMAPMSVSAAPRVMVQHLRHPPFRRRPRRPRPGNHRHRPGPMGCHLRRLSPESACGGFLKWGGDVPVVALAVAKTVFALPIVLVRRWPKDLRAGTVGAFVVSIDIGDVHDDAA